MTSPASIRRWGRTRTRNWRKWSARASPATQCVKVDSHQRTSVAGHLRRGRRRARARPDQPCDGRRRGRGDDDPQRSGEGRQADASRSVVPGEVGTLARGDSDSPGSAGIGSSDLVLAEHRDRVAERDQRALAVGQQHFDQVAGAEILDPRDRAERFARRVDARQADEVGVIIFAVLERRAARRGRPRSAGRAALRRRCGRRCRRAARSRSCWRRAGRGSGAARRRRRRCRAP